MKCDEKSVELDISLSSQDLRKCEYEAEDMYGLTHTHDSFA